MSDFIHVVCLVVLLAPFACILSFICPPSSRMTSSSQFLLPSSYMLAWFRHGTGTHVSYTQNSHPCMQPNKISSYTGSTTKTTKHDWVHDLSIHLNILDRLSIPASPYQTVYVHILACRPDVLYYYAHASGRLWILTCCQPCMPNNRTRTTTM